LEPAMIAYVIGGLILVVLICGITVFFLTVDDDP
jgi:hypothetical protein